MPPFLLSLLANGKFWLYGSAVIAVFGAGLYVRGNWDESKLKSALAEQQTALVAQCTAQKKITEDASHDYQTKITALNSRVATLKLRPKSCVSVTRPTTGFDGSTRANEHGGSNAINSEAFIDYSALAEKYRLQVIGLQDFIKKVWEQ